MDLILHRFGVRKSTLLSKFAYTQPKYYGVLDGEIVQLESPLWAYHFEDPPEVYRQVGKYQFLDTAAWTDAQMAKPNSESDEWFFRIVGNYSEETGALTEATKRWYPSSRPVFSLVPENKKLIRNRKP